MAPVRARARAPYLLKSSINVPSTLMDSTTIGAATEGLVANIGKAYAIMYRKMMHVVSRRFYEISLTMSLELFI